MEEGKIELFSLIPESKLKFLPGVETLPGVAAKVARRPVAKSQVGRRPARSTDEVCTIITKSLDNHTEGLSINWFKVNFGLNAGRVEEAKNKLIKSGKISIINDGQLQKMIKSRLDKK